MKKLFKNLIFFNAVLFYRLVHMITRTGWVVTLKRLLQQAYWKTQLKTMGANAVVLPKVIIRFPEMVELGDNVIIGEFVHIWGLGGVTIGKDTMIAAHSSIISQTHDKYSRIYRESKILKPVVIGNNVWIGSGATILPGVTIGSGAIIGAGAVVTKNVDAGSVVVGVPAKVLSHTDK